MAGRKRQRPGTEPRKDDPAPEGITRRELLKGAYSTAVAAVLFGGSAVAAGCDSVDPRAPTGGHGGYSDFAAYGYSDSLGYHDVAYADAAYDDAYDDGYDDGAVAYDDGYGDGYDDGYSDYSDSYDDGYGNGYGDAYSDGAYGDYADGSYGDYSYSDSYYNYSDSYSDSYYNYDDYARPHDPQRHRRTRHR
jgi:hypothetical protein